MTQLELEKLRTPCEVYKRIVGYIRPVSSANVGKQEEMKDRKMFNIKEA